MSGPRNHGKVRTNGRRKLLIPALAALCGALFAAGCRAPRLVRPNEALPPRVVWAWERAEDLRFLDPKEFAVAFYAQTLTLAGDEVRPRPRRQPLALPENVYLIAVTRIETVKESAGRPALSAAQRALVVEHVKKTLARPNVSAIQIDFDVVVSERAFYRDLLNDLRAALPPATPLSITALASWCAGDAWFGELPVDEAVPMAFEMGADAERVRDFLAKGNDWREPLCRGSYGLSVDEPLAGAAFRPGRRFFYFKRGAWDKRDLEKMK